MIMDLITKKKKISFRLAKKRIKKKSNASQIKINNTQLPRLNAQKKKDFKMDEQNKMKIENLKQKFNKVVAYKYV